MAKRENIVKSELRKIWRSKRKFRKKIGATRYVLKRARERRIYGYSQEDWFEFYRNFCERHIKIFEDYRDKAIGLILRNPQNCKGTQEDYFTMEEQREFFNKLILCLKCMGDEDYLPQHYYNKDEYELSTEELYDIWDKKKKVTEYFFDTMKKHFYNLWD